MPQAVKNNPEKHAKASRKNTVTKAELNAYRAKKFASHNLALKQLNARLIQEKLSQKKLS